MSERVVLWGPNKMSERVVLRDQNIGLYSPLFCSGISPSPINQSAHNLQPANSYNCTQLTPKTASVVPPEDGRLTPETCSGLRHNKVFVKLKVGYVIVMKIYVKIFFHKICSSRQGSIWIFFIRR
jgi:hypothetical protein